MRTIRTMIIDDEPLSREGIAVMLENDPEIEIVAQCGDGQEAVGQILAQQPDLAFLDIHMPRLNGFEVLERLPPERRPLIVFVTAHAQHAVRAFESGAAEYLLKPFQDDRFGIALRRAKDQIRHGDLAEIQRQTQALVERLLEDKHGLKTPRRLSFKVGGSYVVVDPDEVSWVEAQGNQVKLCQGTQTHLVRETLEQMRQRLDPEKFVRVHRSFIVNVDRVKKVVPMLYGDHTVVMSDGAKIRLSRSYRHQLKALLHAPLA